MRKRQRKNIEIYFILYLAAIVFMLPDKPKDIGLASNKIQSVAKGPFSLQPVKTILTCRMTIDSLGPKVLSIDSINTILYTGDVEDIRFNFVVEDQFLRQKENIGPSSKYFRFTEKPDNNAVDFFWTAPLNERTNKTYLVSVIATAKLKHSGNNSDIAGRTIIEKTQFSLNIIYMGPGGDGGLARNFPITVDQFPGRNYGKDLISQTQWQQAIGGEINIQPVQPEVKAIAYQKWYNQIYVFNANPRTALSKNPSIRLIHEPEDNGGSAEVAGIEDNKILLKGKTPSYGKMKVIVTGLFKNGKKELSVDFSVLPVPIKAPQYDNIMYPEKQFTVNPNLPFVSGQDTKAYIKDGDKVLVISEQGEKITFKPEISHIGKILSLERYVDGNLLDQYQIRVLNYAEPQVYSIQSVNESEIRVVTHSFGFYNKERNLCRLEVDGNAVARELFGKSAEPSDQITNVQYFKCTVKNADKPFSFKVRAIDARGKKSPQKSYSE